MKLGVIMQMQDFFKDARYKRAYSTISFAFFVFLVEISIYEMLRKFEIKQYWLLLPLGMYILVQLRNVNR